MSSEPFRILVLSDIHFGSWSCYTADRNPPVTNAQQYARALMDELKFLLGDQPPFDAAVLNGDVTSLNEPVGFEATTYLLTFLVGEDLVLSRARILLLPGNHDIPRDNDKPLPAEVRDDAFRRFYAREMRENHMSEDHLGVLKVFREERIALFGLDSCRIEGSDHPGIGYVGFDQMEQLARALERGFEDNIGPFRRLAFVHHNLEVPAAVTPAWMNLTTARASFSFMADAARVREGLQLFEIDYLFHGHFHSPDLGSRFGKIISVGSVGGRSNTCERKSRHFLVLEVHDTKMAIRDFRRRAAGDWQCELSERALGVRRSIDNTARARGERTEYCESTRWELKQHHGWVEAWWFFRGITEALANMKPKVQRMWRQEGDFEAAWAAFSAAIPAKGPQWFEDYSHILLTDGEDAQGIVSFIHGLVVRGAGG